MKPELKDSAVQKLLDAMKYCFSPAILELDEVRAILSHIKSLEAEVEKWKTASADWNKAAINNMKMAEEYEQQLARERRETAWFQQKASQLADYAEHKVSCRLHKSRDLE